MNVGDASVRPRGAVGERGVGRFLLDPDFHTLFEKGIAFSEVLDDKGIPKSLSLGQNPKKEILLMSHRI
jgi:hypothetical protein